MTTPQPLAFDQEVSLFLATSRTATLATVDAEGGPCAANIQYVHDEDFRLYWVSSPDSAHSQNVGRNELAALTVYAHDDRAENIHGLQLRGKAAVISPEHEEQWNRVWDLYTGKFTFVTTNPQLKSAVEQQRFYVFTPEWIRWIDNRKGFGWKVEKGLDALGD